MFFVQLKVPVLLQGFDDAWQERDQAFRANPVECLPGQHQRQGKTTHEGDSAISPASRKWPCSSRWACGAMAVANARFSIGRELPERTRPHGKRWSIGSGNGAPAGEQAASSDEEWLWEARRGLGLRVWNQRDRTTLHLP
jgi:hypothetical protein